MTLARGERDAMNTDDQLTRPGVPAVTLAGLGHNAHVENPHLSSTRLASRSRCFRRPASGPANRPSSTDERRKKSSPQSDTLFAPGDYLVIGYEIPTV